jgi:mRNA biogenesis factor
LQEDGAKAMGSETIKTAHGHGVALRRPEDSVYYDPVRNPTGAPPPGRPQRYRDDVDMMDPSKAEEFEAAHRARAAAAADSAATAHSGGAILPPPDEPPPGILPPPDMLPPGALPPPTGPPPGFAPGAPPMPPPGWIPPPPMGPPPGFGPGAAQPQPAIEAVVEGAATAMRTIPAQQDSKLTSMVPANVRAKRQKAKVVPTRLPVIPTNNANAGFGLAPQVASSGGGGGGGVTDASVASFLDEISQL